MKLSEVKTALGAVDSLIFQLPDGSEVPEHFHVTEVGRVAKHFIDCGGTERRDTKVVFQLWEAGDHDHRLQARKLRRILDLSESVLGLEDGDVEVEYQGDTIGKYGLTFDGRRFLLTSTHTACLAGDSCGAPAPEKKPALAAMKSEAAACCTPGGGCC